MPNFLYVIKNKEKRNVKLNFEKDRLNLLNMRRKIIIWEKTKLYVQYEKLEKLNNFHIISCQ